MKRTLLAATIATTLVAAATVSSLIATASTTSNDGKTPAAAGPDKGVADGNAPQTGAPLVAESARPPVPIVRKPNPPSRPEEAPRASGETADARGGTAGSGQAGIVTEPIPDLPPSRSEPALPYPPQDYRQAERPPGYAWPVPYPDGWPGRGAVVPDHRIIISRGGQGDVVLIPVDRHMIVIQGWRADREWKREKRRHHD